MQTREQKRERASLNILKEILVLDAQKAGSQNTARLKKLVDEYNHLVLSRDIIHLIPKKDQNGYELEVHIHNREYYKKMYNAKVGFTHLF